MSNENYDVDKMRTHTMAQTTSRIRSGEALNKASEQKKEPSFHEKELQRRAKMTDERMAEVETAGQAKATAFFHRLHNANNPDHGAAVKDFKNLYDSSESKAKVALMAKTAEEMDCHPVERRDVTFEAKTFESCRPKNNVSHTDIAHFNILKDALNEEWMKRGYKGTQAVIDAWQAKYKN